MFYAQCNSCDNKLEYKSNKAANAAVKAKRKCKNCKEKIKLEKMNSWKRNCPKCKSIIKYIRKADFNKAKEMKQICRSCTDEKRRTDNYSGLKRQCPRCKKELSYSCINSCTRANKRKDLCKSCVAKSYYKKPNMLGSKEYKKNMVSKGLYYSLYGRTHLEWSKEYDIPATTFNLFAQSNQDATEEEITNFCKNYKQNLTVIENIIVNELGLIFHNKKCNKSLPYRPDFKISNSIYLNVDGLYWHSNSVIKDRRHHFNIRKSFEENGIRIFQFRSNEVKSKINIIKSIINNANGNIDKKIGARKCSIKKVDLSTAVDFLNKNHIKGYMNSNHIGLFYNDDLVSIMSYKLHTKRGDKVIKIDRFCSKTGYSIMGGFSKLLKNIIRDYPNFPIHYWVDLRYGTGNFLLNHEFKLEKETLGWEWTDYHNTFNRLRCRANMDKRGLSEKEHAEELKWYKIYDAGQRLYIKKNS